jgi:hypothetical protein
MHSCVAYQGDTGCRDASNKRQLTGTSQAGSDDRTFGPFPSVAHVPCFGFRGLGAGSSAAVTRSSSPSHSASSHPTGLGIFAP